MSGASPRQSGAVPCPSDVPSDVPKPPTLGCAWGKLLVLSPAPGHVPEERTGGTAGRRAQRAPRNPAAPSLDGFIHGLDES